MTQPAKVQEPSMEEILASIRRIIADDEAKPPAAEKAASVPEPAKAEKPAAPAPKPPMNDIPPSKIPAAVAAAAKTPPPPPRPAPAPAAPVSNNQDDIDALLAGLDETTSAEEVRPAQSEPEVLELTDDMAVAPPTPAPSAPPVSFRKVDPQDDIEFVEAARSAPKASAPKAPAYDPPVFEQTAPKQPILSQTTVNAVESAFNTLANTVLSNNARTLEDLVKEMLRPMLKAWLDDNLPALVERIVKAEIERVARGR
jgi:uncharacterized protein